MQKVAIERRFPTFVDPLIIAFLGALIYFTTSFGQQVLAPFHGSIEIDLSLHSLPEYAFFSMMRGLIAYAISLAFTIVIGYWAAHSKPAEKILIPFLDIMQSVPVLGFLPGLVLGLVALFPNNNLGLELAAILLIFTGQVWNMTFSFYSSLKSIPTDMNEASSIIGLSRLQRLKIVELPFSATNLTWNSIMSMAGGWFFLTVCEAFVLGDRKYRLPGLGAYMAEAIEKGDMRAMTAGIIAMALVIIALDVFLWKPTMAFVHRFRLEEIEGEKPDEPIVDLLLRESYVANWIRTWLRARRLGRLLRRGKPVVILPEAVRSHRLTTLATTFNNVFRAWTLQISARILRVVLPIIVIASLIFGLFKLVETLRQVPLNEWAQIFLYTLYTFMRVIGALVFSTIWTVPLGVWISQSQRRLKITQPIIQLMASFPAPMLYPLAAGLILWLGVSFEFGAMALMLLGVQWYVLFNVLAGGLRIPTELKLASRLMGVSRMSTWRHLLLPSVFPSLVTGWVTAAGGAWNASIVAEIMTYKGHTLQAKGLGAMISQAAEKGDFAQLAASLLVMVGVVVIFNRLVWNRLYHAAQTRFRLDL